MYNSPISRKCMYRVGNTFYLVANEVSENKGVAFISLTWSMFQPNYLRTSVTQNISETFLSYSLNKTLVSKGGRKTFVFQTHRPYCSLNYKIKEIIQPQIKSRIRRYVLHLAGSKGITLSTFLIQRQIIVILTIYHEIYGKRLLND